jgi:hypothetical protein
LAERQELIRLCAARVIADHEAGRGNDPHRLALARGVVAAIQPINRPLGDGSRQTETL